MFDPSQFIMTAPPLTVAAAIIVAALISEDAATLTAATLAATKALEPRLAFASSVLGIWLGDLGLYGLAYRYGSGVFDKDWGRKLARPDSVQRGREWFQRRGSLALFLSRCLPGTRLPISLAAGIFRMRAAQFASVGAAGAIAWVSINFAVIHYSQRRLQAFVRINPSCGLLIAAGFFVLMLIGQWVWSHKRVLYRRWSQWEFWPAWLFYIPVAGMWVWLSIRHRSFSLPAIANPGQVNGGLVGESKAQILSELMSAAPNHVAPGYLLEAGDYRERGCRLSELMREGMIQFPFVLKPNVGQRGVGFKKILCFEEAENYLRTVASAVIVQKYVDAPKEVGIFFARLPSQDRGEIIAITEKRFPEIIGDGKHTLEELVRADARASMIASTYLRRFDSARDRVIPEGTRLRLVEAGNHCQGCIFGDGMHLYSELLRARIEKISRRLPEFYIGRYDVRYRDDDLLRAGLDFQIIELNGAASEATSIYDAKNTLVSAYKTLFRQWSLVFTAGAQNRARGFRPPSLLQLWRDWVGYSKQALRYPLAD